MSEHSAIEWTDATWSPWEGCTKVSPGCDHCYAEGMNRWLRKGANWGPGAPRREYSDAHWRKPLAWNAKAEREGRRICVFPSVCDPFDNEVPARWRERFFKLIAITPHLTWQLLTKRIGNAQSMLTLDRWPTNCWLGATVVNQEEADRDIPKLLATPARIRFLSCEPMIGPITLRTSEAFINGRHVPEESLRIDWAIVGAESGPKARPLHAEWVRSIVAQCKAAGVPCFVKQLGRRVHDSGMSSPGEQWPAGIVREPLPRKSEADPPFVVTLRDPKGGDPAEWPEDLRVRELPLSPAVAA